MIKPGGRPRGRPKEKEYVPLMARVPEDLAERAKRYAALHQQTISTVLLHIHQDWECDVYLPAAGETLPLQECPLPPPPAA